MNKLNMLPLSVIFWDNHLIVVNKPARVPVGSEDSGDQTLLSMTREWNAARQVDNKKGYCVPIHFLDRPVSGAIVFALSSKSAARLNQQFREHSICKTYFAISEGVPAKEEATLEHWLTKDHQANITAVCEKSAAGAKKCELSYRVIATAHGKSMLLVKPITGRSHQIRVQMSAIGCPLVGDVKYGASKGWGGLVALHASQLELSHPVSKELVCFKANVPAYWDDIWPGDWPRDGEGLYGR